MSEPLFLITGATGKTGQTATAELRKLGQRVRCLVHREDARSEALRSKGAEVVIGDLLDLDSVRGALEGVSGAYFVYPFRNELIEAAVKFAQAATEANVKSIVEMSQISARRDAGSNAARDHWLCEQMFDRSGVPTTHIRPTFFAEWLISRIPGLELENGIIHFPFAAARHAPIAAEDQGRLIAAILVDPTPHAGKVYTLHGPEELDHHQIADKLSKALGRRYSYEPSSIPEFENRLEARGAHPRLVQHLKHVAQDYQDGIFAGTNDIIERVTGTAPLTVEEFAIRNRRAFTA